MGSRERSLIVVEMMLHLGLQVRNGSNLYHVRVDWAIAGRHVQSSKVVNDSYFHMMFGWTLPFDRMIFIVNQAWYKSKKY